VAGQNGRQSIIPTDPQAVAFQTEVGFADAVVVGDMVYLSGVVAAPQPGETGLQAAYERAFARIGTVLQRAGSSWADVVDMTTYHTDLAGQLNDLIPVKNRYVAAPFPAWTAIGITALYEPTAVTEIKIVARVTPR
jgi:enamine deaminase RidA (YjgF/YER057c/UK114 family)